MPVVHIWYLRSIPSKISYLLGYTTKQLEQIVYFEKFVILHPGASGREYGELLEEEEYLKLDIEFGIDVVSEEDRDEDNYFIAEMGGEAVLRLLRDLDVVGKINELLALDGSSSFTNQGNQQARVANRSRFVSTFIGIAATLFLAISLVITLNLNLSASLGERVADEITMNHLKNLAVEYPIGDINQLSAAMTDLGFSLRQPTHSELAGLTLIGARYCSIQGQIAAQLKYQDQDNKITTLYQTQSNPLLENLAFNDEDHDGVQIIVWRDSDIVYGLAK